jgi:hypothetical protein
MQMLWGNHRTRGHSRILGGIRLHSDIQEISKYAYIVGLQRIQGIRKYIQGSRGMFRVFKGKGLKEF